jgi:hypothetical protein
LFFRPHGPVKVALTFFAPAMVRVHVPVPVHGPLQPVNVDVPPGVAERVTSVFTVKECWQVLPQSIPEGLLVTVPAPPFLLTFVTLRE